MIIFIAFNWYLIKISKCYFICEESFGYVFYNCGQDIKQIEKNHTKNFCFKILRKKHQSRV